MKKVSYKFPKEIKAINFFLKLKTNKMKKVMIAVLGLMFFSQIGFAAKMHAVNKSILVTNTAYNLKTSGILYKQEPKKKVSKKSHSKKHHQKKHHSKKHHKKDHKMK